jgi:hypothetical protein
VCRPQRDLPPWDVRTIQTGEGIYREKVKKMLAQGGNRLVVSLDDLREQKRELCEGLVSLSADRTRPLSLFPCTRI